eukprot:3664258-Lingulodinium_polyedra.AAC.1
MEHVLERGRWSSTASARIYIQDGVATAVAITLTRAEEATVASLCSAARQLWCARARALQSHHQLCC